MIVLSLLHSTAIRNREELSLHIFEEIKQLYITAVHDKSEMLCISSDMVCESLSPIPLSFRTIAAFGQFWDSIETILGQLESDLGSVLDEFLRQPWFYTLLICILASNKSCYFGEPKFDEGFDDVEKASLIKSEMHIIKRMLEDDFSIKVDIVSDL